MSQHGCYDAAIMLLRTVVPRAWWWHGTPSQPCRRPSMQLWQPVMNVTVLRVNYYSGVCATGLGPDAWAQTSSGPDSTALISDGWIGSADGVGSGPWCGGGR